MIDLGILRESILVVLQGLSERIKLSLESVEVSPQLHVPSICLRFVLLLKLSSPCLHPCFHFPAQLGFICRFGSVASVRGRTVLSRLTTTLLMRAVLN